MVSIFKGFAKEIEIMHIILIIITLVSKQTLGQNVVRVFIVCKGVSAPFPSIPPPFKVFQTIPPPPLCKKPPSCPDLANQPSLQYTGSFFDKLE